MNILVTGATGFLGSYIIKNLSKKNKVYATGRNINKMKKLDNVEWIVADLSAKQEVEVIFEKNYDFVIHCAALSSTSGSYEEFYAANFIGTKNILEVLNNSKHFNTRLIHISTPSIYATDKNREAIKEGDKIDLNYIKKSNYIWTKYLAEELVKKEANVTYIIIRPRAIIGVGDNSIWPSLMRANKKIGIPLFRGGKTLLSYSYIKSISEFICSLTSKGIDKNLEFNLADANIEMNVLVERLKVKSPFPIKGKPLNFKLVSSTLNLVEKLNFTKKHLSINKESLALLYYDMTFDTSHAQEAGYKTLASFETIAKENFEAWDNKEQRWKL